MKKTAKWVIGILLTPFVLFALLAVALYLPPIQNWAVHTVADYASEEMGMDISVGKVRLVFPLDLGVDDVKVIQQNDSLPQVKDTIADLKHLVADVQLLPLLKSNVEIDRFDIYDLKVNTSQFIPQARVKGTLGTLTIESHGIDLNAETVKLNKAYIADANVNVELSDTVPEDTTESENYWKIDLDQLTVKNTDVTVHMPGDTLQVEALLTKVNAKGGLFDLGKGLYQVQQFDWQEGGLKYDNNFEPRLKGLDFNHIALSDVNIGIDSLCFCSPDLTMAIRQCSLKEKSGIALDSLSAHIRLDSTKVLVKGMMATPASRLLADVDMDLNAFDDKNPGKVDADVEASIGKRDLLLAAGVMPENFLGKWPDKPLTVKAVGKGNLQHVDIKTLEAALPTAFCVKASGFADNPMDMDKLKAKLHLDARTYNMSFVKTLLSRDLQKMINIPSMHAVADVNAEGHSYDLVFKVNEGRGQVSGKGKINTNTMSYTASVDAKSLQLQHFVRGMGLGGFTGKADVKGHGTDVFSPKTNITAKANVGSFTYDKWNLNNMNLDATLAGGKASARVVSRNSLVNGTIGLDALMSRNPIQATLTTDLQKADLYRLKVAEAPLTVSCCAHIDVATDMDEYYKVQGLVSDLTIRDTANVYRPDDMVLDLLTRRDTTHAIADCGDFHLNADVRGGYKYLLGLSGKLADELERQFTNRIIDETALRRILPTGHVYLSAGQENPIARFAKRYDCSYYSIFMDVTSSPKAGINGDINVDSLKTESLQLDKICMKLNSDEQKMHYKLTVENGPDNPQYSFYAEANGILEPNGTSLSLALDDDKRKRAFDIGIGAKMEADGIRLNFTDTKQILGYKAFTVNDDNYVSFAKNMRVSADLKMKSEDGMGLQVYTDDTNTDALQDITLSLHKLDLAEIVSALPYMPKISGVMDGDFHAIMTEKDLSVSSSVALQKFIYEDCELGNLSSEFVYVPQEDGSHHVDGLLYKDDQEVASVIGNYNAEGEGSIDLVAELKQLPLNLVNGFIPDQIIGLEGTGEGTLTVKGSPSKPIVDGEVFLQDASLVSVPYGISLKFDDDPVRITGSKLLLENFQLYANNDQPLIVRGNVDFSDLDHISMDMRMRAKNYLLIDAKETRKSEAYGKGYVNFYGRMTGELDQLQVKGKLEVLSTSDLYYILRDSPITTDNRLKELVTFTDLDSDVPVTVVRPTVDGLYVDLNVTVDEGAHVTCWLNTNHTNYLDILGGGDLRMIYTADNLSLTGRYTISSGEMKYSLPVIPLKTFTIADGSYIEFTGDMMNPRLSITATEENKTTVEISGVKQSVLFKCGVKISKTLQDMGLEFTIDAPENQTVSDELQTKSLEERGKLAVTMLTTGMYLSENNTSSFTMNSALSSFLQQEINQIAGSALRTLDLSVGMENSSDETGHMHTDYSFKFAKRFWNNRLSISVGGKISTGPDVSGQNNTFFDNVELQYRTSNTSNQYLQLFYKRAVYDYLEGYVGEYGAGYMWKRKLQNFRDIFQFGDSDLSSKSSAPADTTKTNRKSVEGIEPKNTSDTLKVVREIK